MALTSKRPSALSEQEPISDQLSHPLLRHEMIKSIHQYSPYHDTFDIQTKHIASMSMSTGERF